MDIIQFPPARVLEINHYILGASPGHGTAHAFSDANKRTGLAVCLEYLSLNEFEIERDNEKLADAMVDLVLGVLPESQFADILYALWLEEQTAS